MKSFRIALIILLAGTGRVFAQGAPDIVWQIPTPNTLANSVMAVAWSPSEDSVAVGSTDRWFRLRGADSGALAYSVLEPPRQSGVGQILFSTDGASWMNRCRGITSTAWSPRSTRKRSG